MHVRIEFLDCYFCINLCRRNAWLDANKGHQRDYKKGGSALKPTYTFDQAEYDDYQMDAEGANGLYDPQHPIGYNPFNQEYVGWCGFHWASADPAPTVWSTKHWRNGRGTKLWNDMWLPNHIYFKRYANVILDQAECCFRLGKEAEGWALVNQIREPYLRSDMHKSGFLEDHVNTVYPKNSLPEYGPTVITECHTARNFDFSMDKMFMPIPENEILMNPNCEQNPGY